MNTLVITPGYNAEREKIQKALNTMIENHNIDGFYVNHIGDCCIEFSTKAKAEKVEKTLKQKHNLSCYCEIRES